MWRQKYKPRLSDSFLGWLMGEDQSARDLTHEAKLIEVRLRIIKTLKQRGLDEDASLLRRVARSPALEDLWFLRPDIMQTLSSLHGETRACNIMTSLITPLFAGLLSTQLLRQHSVRGAQHASG